MRLLMVNTKLMRSYQPDEAIWCFALYDSSCRWWPRKRTLHLPHSGWGDVCARLATWLVDSRKNKIIGVISTHMADYIFPSIISGIDSVVTDQGYSLIVGNTLNNHDRERQTLLNMLDLKIAGLIIEPTQSALPNSNLDLYRQLQNYHIPTILFHSTYPGFSFPTLLTKDLEAEK